MQKRLVLALAGEFELIADDAAPRYAGLPGGGVQPPGEFLGEPDGNCITHLLEL